MAHGVSLQAHYQTTTNPSTSHGLHRSALTLKRNPGGYRWNRFCSKPFVRSQSRFTLCQGSGWFGPKSWGSPFRHAALPPGHSLPVSSRIWLLNRSASSLVRVQALAPVAAAIKGRRPSDSRPRHNPV